MRLVVGLFVALAVARADAGDRKVQSIEEAARVTLENRLSIAKETAAKINELLRDAQRARLKVDKVRLLDEVSRLQPIADAYSQGKEPKGYTCRTVLPSSPLAGDVGRVSGRIRVYQVIGKSEATVSCDSFDHSVVMSGMDTARLAAGATFTSDDVFRVGTRDIDGTKSFVLKLVPLQTYEDEVQRQFKVQQQNANVKQPRRRR